MRRLLLPCIISDISEWPALIPSCVTSILLHNLSLQDLVCLYVTKHP